MKRTSVLASLVYIIFTFCIVFMFNVVSFIDSSMIVGVILFALLFINQKYQSIFVRMLAGKKLRNLLIVFFAFFLWIVICLLANGTFDLSFVKTLIHLLLQIGICLMFYCYLASKNASKNIPNYLVAAFLIQSVIIILGMISPSIRSLLLSTKSDLEVQISMNYGFRGASLSGSSYFGLAVSFGLIYVIFFTFRSNKKNKHLFLKVILLIILVVASISAGRSSLIGLGVAFVFAILEYRKSFTFKAVLIFIIGIVILAVLAVVVLRALSSYLPYRLVRILDSYTFYATEFFSSASGGVFKTTSTEELFNDMFINIKVDFGTFLFGDGIYETEGGAYYMLTDSGVMRPLLYVGFMGLVFLTIIQFQFLNFGNLWKKNKKLFVLLLLYAIVLQIKGEILGFALMFNSIVVLFSLSYKDESPRYVLVRKVKEVPLTKQQEECAS